MLVHVDVPVSTRGDFDAPAAVRVGALAEKGNQLSIGPARLGEDGEEAMVGIAKVALVLSTARGLGVHL